MTGNDKICIKHNIFLEKENVRFRTIHKRFFFIFLNPSLNTVSTEVASVQWQVYKSVGSDS